MHEITVFVKCIPPDMDYHLYSAGLVGTGKTNNIGVVVKTADGKIHYVPWDNIMLVSFGAKTDETFKVPGEGSPWSLPKMLERHVDLMEMKKDIAITSNTSEVPDTAEAELMNSKLGPR